LELFFSPGVEMRKTVLLVIFFVFYAVLVTAVLLAVRFPKDLFLTGAVMRLEQAFPGSTWSISDVSMRYPAAVVFGGVQVDHEVTGRPVPIEEVVVEIDRQHPLSGFSTRFNVLGAEVAGELRYDQQQQLLHLPAVAVQGMDLARLPGLADRLERQFEGSVTFTGTYRKSLRQQDSGTLQGTVRIENLHFPLKRPILRENSLHFAALSAQIEASGALISLSQGQATGPSYSGSFSGQVRLNRPWEESEVEVFGEFQAQPEYLSRKSHLARSFALLGKTYGEGPIPCTIRGNLTGPIFAFGRGQRP
jgi:type II secretion system protein N